jgi:CubicO group peptidase (beta-lactamase class C family)
LRGHTYTFNYGHLEPGGKRAPTRKTLYPIASITKTFTGALLAQAQLEGKLKLDDDVRLYLEGTYPNLEYEGHPIRLFDLLDHRSGLPFFMPDRPETRPDFASDEPWATRASKALAGYTRADFYADLHRVKLDAIPGESFRYSNAAAQLAGYLLEHVYGEPYETLLKRKVLAPLGMRETTITLSPRQFAVRTRGYDGQGRQVPDNPDALQGAGAIKSSVDDMLRYIAWQVAERDPAVQLSHQPFLKSGNYSAGLNWQMLSDSGNRVIWQSGDFEGFHAYCIVEPERGLGLVALFNQAGRETSGAHGAMVNEILKGIDPGALLLP